MFTSRTPKQLFLLHFIWSLLLFLLCKYLIGNFCEVYEFIHPATLSGKLTDGVPGNIIYPIANVGLGGMYKCMYSLSPDFPWYDCAMGFLMVFSMAVIFFSVHLLLHGKVKTGYVFLINALLFLIFNLDNIVNWNITRGAFLPCIASFVFFVAVLLKQPTSAGIWSPFLFSSILFSCGVMVRPEVGQLMLILIFIWVFLSEGVSKNILLKVLAFALPVFIIVGYVIADRLMSNEFYLQLDPLTEYQVGLGKVIGIDQMKTSEDSMKYIALREGIVNDPIHISNEFIKSITSESKLAYNSFYMNRAITLVIENLLPYIHSLILNLIIIITGVWFLYPRLYSIVRFILFSGAFWTMIIAISYFMVMESRLMSPLLLFYTLGNLLFIRGEISFSGLSPIFRNLGIASLIFVLCISVFNAYNTGNQYESTVHIRQRTFDAIKESAKNKIIVPDANVTMLLLESFRPFQNPDFSAFNKVILLDVETLSLHPAYRFFLDKNCNCNSVDFAELFDYLYSQKENVIFAGNSDRIRLFQNYLNIARHREYTFVHESTIRSSSEGLNEISIFSFE